jgi:hypothetical protein
MPRIFTNEDPNVYLMEATLIYLVFLESLGRDTCHFTRLAFWFTARDL